MPTRTISLTEHFDRFIEAAVADGAYQSASEVIGAGLRLLEREQQAHEAKLNAFRAAVQVGIDEIDRGEYIDVEIHELGDFLHQSGEEATREAARR
jgi:antitoxin ParD1/3/4